MSKFDMRADVIFENFHRNPALLERGLGCYSLRMLDWIAGDFLGSHINVMAMTRYGKEPARAEASFDSFFSSEKSTRVRTDSSMDELQPFLEESIGLLHENFPESYVLCYQSSRQLERLARRYPSIRMMNPPAAMSELLNRKTWVRRKLKALGVPVIPGDEVLLSPDLFRDLVDRYGMPLVVSLDQSAAGSGVHLIESESQFRAVAAANLGAPASVMQYIDGKSMSLTGVRTQDYVILGEPSLQVIGQKSLTNLSFGWCGNDFSGSHLTDHEVEQMRDMQTRIGEWLGELRVGKQKGFHSIFGVDYISDGENVYFTEINPRFLGTTALVADRQQEMGKIPVSFFHLVPHLPDVYLDDEFVAEYNRRGDPLNVSQMCLHNIMGEDVVVESSIEPGRYIFERDQLRYLGPAQRLADTESYDEVLITGEIPVEGTHLLRTSDEICKVYTYRPVLGRDGRTLNFQAEQLVKAVQNSFRLSPVRK